MNTTLITIYPTPVNDSQGEREWEILCHAVENPELNLVESKVAVDGLNEPSPGQALTVSHGWINK